MRQGALMKSIQEGADYNERLFSGGVRARLHLARFTWLAREVARRKCPHATVMELGCYDAKSIHYLPQKPVRYVGFDANWEGGLDQAIAMWKSYAGYSFQKATAPEDIQLQENEQFDLAIVMDTLEHVPSDQVDSYLCIIERHLSGYLFVTVPNEKGLVFLVKWIAKSLFSKDADRYTFKEAVNATLGRMTRIVRNEHKGFDYVALIRQIENHFEVIRVVGYPFPGLLPPCFGFGVGVIARKKSAPHKTERPNTH